MADLNFVWPIVAIIVTAIVGILTYWYQKRLDRLATLNELRRQKYTEYLNALHNVAHTDDAENLKIFQTLGLALTAIASDEVILRIGEFTNYMHNTQIIPKDSSIFKPQIAKIILAMRRDCFQSSSLRLEDLVSIIPLR